MPNLQLQFLSPLSSHLAKSGQSGPPLQVTPASMNASLRRQKLNWTDFGQMWESDFHCTLNKGQKGRRKRPRRRGWRNAQELKQTWVFSPPGVIQVTFKAAHKERGGGRVCVETENHSLVDLGPGPRGNDLGDIRVA